jgi:hypothetical protein
MEEQSEYGDISLKELMRESYKTAREHGWWDLPIVGGVPLDRNFGEILSLWHSEISEALEEWRNGHDLQEIYYRKSDGKPEGIPVEIADLFIRMADLCEAKGVPVIRALKEKLSFNKSRPYRHGDKRA